MTDQPTPDATPEENPQAAWLRAQIAELEADALTVEDGEDPTTGLTADEQNRLLQYRHELDQLESAQP